MAFPFSAIVGQDEMKRALLISAVDPRIGGVMVFGDRGTGKSTAARALSALLPPMVAIAGCRYNCAPEEADRCPDRCAETKGAKTAKVPVPFVDLPLGATEDRVLGALDLERALGRGERRSSRGCSPARIAATCISTRSTCSRTIWSTCCSTSRSRVRIWSNARGCRCGIRRSSC